jgi:cell wall assembly regulator SMI1
MIEDCNNTTKSNKAMLELQKSLERIKSWVKVRYPEQADRLLPGLTDEEIEGITKHIPYPLPEELKCFYKNINGVSFDRSNYSRNLFIWERHTLLSLQEAMDEWYQWYQRHKNRYESIINSTDFFLNPAPKEHSYGVNCFPFLSNESGNEGYAIIDANDLRACKVIFTSKRDQITRRYISLTALVQSLADWYEHENSLDTGIFSVSSPAQEKYFHTWKKYNTYTDIAAPFDFLDELYEWQSNQISATADFDFIDDSIEFTPDTSLESSDELDEMDEIDKLYEWYLNQIDELDELYEWQSNQISATADFDFIDDSIEFTPDFS